MNFTHPLLFSGTILLLIGVPLLIHLINMIRHRRVQWAAMEFLLASQKKNRRWVWMKQLLLLLLRMLAVAMILLMLAGWTLTGDWAKVLGDSQTHHYILIDDSYSMSTKTAGISEFDRAVKSAEKLAAKISAQAGQTVTLMRFSKAAKMSLGTQADIASRVVGENFEKDFDKTISKFRPTQLSIAPTAALAGIEKLIESDLQKKQVLHLISDFRKIDWGNSTALKQQLKKFNTQRVQLHFINSSLTSQPNLAITNIQTSSSTHAANIPLRLKVTVKNFGNATVKEVLVSIQYAENPQSGKQATRETDQNDRWKKLPAMRFDEIASGKSESREIEMRFETAGQHEVQAKLEGDYLSDVDSLVTDNQRTAIINIANEVPVLVIDGDPASGDAFHLTHGLNPALFQADSKFRTGLKPIVQPTSYLRQSPNLNQYHSIYLLNIGRIDDSSIHLLESYVKSGGGLAFFTGPKTSRSFVNEYLYKDGKGLFPAPIHGQSELFVDENSGNPKADIIVKKNSLFEKLTEPLFKLKTVRISRYQTLQNGWKPKKKSETQVLARLRNGAPFILGHSLGKGRIIAVLTTSGRNWNNWAPVFNYPLFIQILQGRLAELRHIEPNYVVGSPLQKITDPKKVQSKVTILTPHSTDSPLAIIQRQAIATENNLQLVAIGNNTQGETDVSGIYQFEILRKPTGLSITRFAVNVATEEGDLDTISAEQLATQLKEIKYVYHSYDELQRQQKHLAGVDTSGYLLYFLVAILLGEMILSYLASYHQKKSSRGTS